MAVKIEIKNNYLFAKDTVTGDQLSGAAKNIEITRVSDSSNLFYIKGTNIDDSSQGRFKDGVDIADIIDASDMPFASATAFEDWATASTSFSSGGGNGFTGVVIDSQVISNGGTLSIPASIPQFTYLRFEINGAGLANVALDGIVKSDFRGQL